MDAFDTLGVAPNCTKELAKAAYRRLASLHHPDRGGSKEVFQNVQAAWDAIDKGYRRAVRPSQSSSYFSSNSSKSKPSGFTSAFEDYVRQTGQRKQAPDRNAPNYSFGQKETRGGSVVVEVPVSDTSYQFQMGDFEYTVPAFTPDGWEGSIRGVPIVIGGQQAGKEIRVRVKLVSPVGPNIVFRGIPDVSGGFANLDPNLAFTTNIGDCVIVIRTNAINLIVGAWVNVPDCFGKMNKMRIPAGFSPERRLRIAGAGFYSWDTFSEKPIINKRGDMIVQIVPEFTSLKDANVNDLDNLKEAIKGV